MGRLLFHQLFEPESSTYTYLLADAESRDAVLIDPVLEMVDRDLRWVDESNLHLRYILETHIHADHITGAGEIRKRRPGVQVGVPRKADVSCADIQIGDGDEILFGAFRIKALETPGHTKASISYFCEDMVFTGDALLIRGTGRTDFQSGCAETLYDSITQKLFRLPPETKVYPGHDYKGLTSSTIGMEIKHNPRIGGGKSKEDFVRIMESLHLSTPKKIHLAVPANKRCGE